MKFEIYLINLKKLKRFFGTDEAKFHLIFATRSFAHLRQLFIEYETRAKQKIEDSIKSEMSGNTAKSYIALGFLNKLFYFVFVEQLYSFILFKSKIKVNNVKSRCGYFAQAIKKAIKGLGTDEVLKTLFKY